MPSANSSLSHSLVISLSSPSVPSPVAAASRASWEKRWRTFKVEERKKRKLESTAHCETFFFFYYPPPPLSCSRRPRLPFSLLLFSLKVPQSSFCLFWVEINCSCLFCWGKILKGTERRNVKLLLQSTCTFSAAFSTCRPFPTRTEEIYEVTPP